MQLNCKDKVLDLTMPAVMGVLNVTPDSFSDGGRYTAVDEAVSQALRMIDEGAAIIDIGGESTRPGALPVDEAEELRRVIPVIERLVTEVEVIISIDTMKPAVMREACRAGASLINDVNALRAAGAIEATLETEAAVCLMHMQGEPRRMQENPHYENVITDVADFLEQRLQACKQAGIAENRIALDPGFGFGKTLAHNLQLLAQLEKLTSLGCPLLVGVSRKSMFAALLDVPPTERVHGGVAAAAIAVAQGAKIIRSHDVRATVHAVKVAAAIQQYR